MSEYYNFGIDPFASGTPRDSSPVVRRGYRDRRRSRTPTKYHRYGDRGRSRDRRDKETSPSFDASRQDSKRCRSISTSPSLRNDNRECEIFGVRHKSTTVGCPEFLKFMNIKDYIDSNSKGTLSSTREKFEQDRSRVRSRSRSASVRRGYSRDHQSSSSDNNDSE